jgi:hypothetical protein
MRRVIDTVGSKLWPSCLRLRRARPMFLLFDDLHWADKPLLLLRHVMRSASMASLAIVVRIERASSIGRTR